MDALLLTCRCLLAVVFLVAAVGKLLDPSGSRRALEAFGVPRIFVPAGARLLPSVELAAAIALVLAPSARWGAVGALLLLLAFAAAVARVMARGQAPDCHCFGQLHSEPAGRATLVRNLALIVPAVVVIAGGPGPALDEALEGLSAAQLALVATAVLAAVLAVAVGQLWSDRRRLAGELRAAIAARAPAGLPPGTLAPGFALDAVRGAARSLDDLLSDGRPAVLVFISTSCAPCLQMLPSLSRWQETLSLRLPIAAVFAGERTEIGRLSDEHELSLVLAEDRAETFERYRLRATPSAVLVGPDGVLSESPAEGLPAIETLIRAALARSGTAPSDPVPSPVQSA